jgi:hypothetical protein
VNDNICFMTVNTNTLYSISNKHLILPNRKVWQIQRTNVHIITCPRYLISDIWIDLWLVRSLVLDIRTLLHLSLSGSIFVPRVDEPWIHNHRFYSMCQNNTETKKFWGLIFNLFRTRCPDNVRIRHICIIKLLWHILGRS